MSSWDLGSHVQFDMMARYVDTLTGGESVQGSPALIPSYIDMDLRLAWRPEKNLEFQVVGQNLLHSYVQQFNAENATIQLPTEIPARSTGKSPGSTERPSEKFVGLQFPN